MAQEKLSPRVNRRNIRHHSFDFTFMCSDESLVGKKDKTEKKELMQHIVNLTTAETFRKQDSEVCCWNSCRLD